MCVFTCILNFTVSKTTKENGVYGEFKSNHNNNNHHLMRQHHPLLNVLIRSLHLLLPVLLPYYLLLSAGGSSCTFSGGKISSIVFAARSGRIGTFRKRNGT